MVAIGCLAPSGYTTEELELDILERAKGDTEVALASGLSKEYKLINYLLPLSCIFNLNKRRLDHYKKNGRLGSRDGRHVFTYEWLIDYQSATCIPKIEKWAKSLGKLVFFFSFYKN